ncbi:MAG: FAD-binding protein, partial [Planctomycetota bacterium]
TPEGRISLRFEGGSSHPRTAFAQTATGFLILKALHEQILRFEAKGMVKRMEYWEFLRPIFDGQGRFAGIIAIHRHTMEIQAFLGKSVVMATGGLGRIYGTSTNSLLSTGIAASRMVQHGAYFCNGEFIQFHPTAVPLKGAKMLLLSESIRGEGGRVWTWRDGKKWYFLEEWFPEYGNLAPRDMTSRAIFKVIHQMSIHLEGQEAVYLDITHLPRKKIEISLGDILQKYHHLTGQDPYQNPMKVRPAMHYSMGGLWVDEKQATSIPGVFAAGEVEFQYHGANRLGGNSLMACLFGGKEAGLSLVEWVEGQEIKNNLASMEIHPILEEEKKILEELKNREGRENPYLILKELQENMMNKVGLVREKEGLIKAVEKIQELEERLYHLRICDPSDFCNETLLFARGLKDMIRLAHIIAKGALMREESRGGHFRSDFPHRRDGKFLKTTVAKWTEEGPAFWYEEVDTRWIEPAPRKHQEPLAS